MYFISRNNRIYDYIAHSNKRRRYFYTGVFFVCFVASTFYGLYCLTTVYDHLYEQQRTALMARLTDMQSIREKTQKLINTNTEVTQEIQKNCYEGALPDYFKNKLLFVFDVIKQCGLKLQSYGVEKEHTYGWYSKEKAHIDILGTKQQVMNFFEKIKNSHNMISINQWSLAKSDNNMFHARCDVEFILCEKNKSLQL